MVSGGVEVLRLSPWLFPNGLALLSGKADLLGLGLAKWHFIVVESAKNAVNESAQAVSASLVVDSGFCLRRTAPGWVRVSVCADGPLRQVRTSSHLCPYLSHVSLGAPDLVRDPALASVRPYLERELYPVLLVFRR